MRNQYYDRSVYPRGLVVLLDFVSKGIPLVIAKKHLNTANSISRENLPEIMRKCIEETERTYTTDVRWELSEKEQV